MACPRCGSTDRAVWITGTPQNPDRERCSDPWHRVPLDSHEALRVRVEEAEEVRTLRAERDRLAAALRPVVDALTWALGEVMAWCDDEVNEADCLRACSANMDARAALASVSDETKEG